MESLGSDKSGPVNTERWGVVQQSRQKYIESVYFQEKLQGTTQPTRRACRTYPSQLKVGQKSLHGMDLGIEFHAPSKPGISGPVAVPLSPKILEET